MGRAGTRGARAAQVRLRRRHTTHRHTAAHGWRTVGGFAPDLSYWVDAPGPEYKPVGRRYAFPCFENVPFDLSAQF